MASRRARRKRCLGDGTPMDPAAYFRRHLRDGMPFFIIIRWLRSLRLPPPTGYRPLSLRDKHTLPHGPTALPTVLLTTDY
jgi:hypothetical protein